MAPPGGTSCSPPTTTSGGGAAKPRGRACLCAPTTHPGSFRCGLHRGQRRAASGRGAGSGGSGSPGQADAKAAKASSMRALLMQIIGPSRQDLCRRRDFQPRPTRFALMSGGHHGVAVI